MTADESDDESEGECYERIHEEACARGEHSYIDPKTDAFVFTRLGHLDRGYCCESGCRHCPYGYFRG